MSIESIRVLHDTAMMHLEHATVLRFTDVPAVKQSIDEQHPQIKDAATELRVALELELQAAKLAQELNDQETRSFLMKSAAAIAYRSGDYKRALQLAQSLLPYAPALIAAETKLMIQTIEQAQDKNFIRPSKEALSRGRTINWKPGSRLIAGFAAVIMFAFLVGDGANSELINLVLALAVALLILINVVK